MIREKCIGSFLEALEAQELGAERVELCDNLTEGGTTPSYGTIKMVVEKLNIPAFVIIRPRGGDFYYTPEEIEIMKEDIKICKELGVKGVVIGALNRDNTINYDAIKDMIDLAKPMSITFHKAIDELENPVTEVKKLANLGVNTYFWDKGNSIRREKYLERDDKRSWRGYNHHSSWKSY